MLVLVYTHGKQHHLHWIIGAIVGGSASMKGDPDWKNLAFPGNVTVPVVIVKILGLQVVPVVKQLWIQ